MTPKELAEKIVEIDDKRNALNAIVADAEKAYTDAANVVSRMMKTREEFCTANRNKWPTAKEIELAREVVRLHAKAEVVDWSLPVLLIDNSKPFSLANLRISKEFTSHLFGHGCEWSLRGTTAVQSLDLRDQSLRLLVTIEPFSESVVAVSRSSGAAYQASTCDQVRQALGRIAENTKAP